MRRGFSLFMGNVIMLDYVAIAWQGLCVWWEARRRYPGCRIKVRYKGDGVFEVERLRFSDKRDKAAYLALSEERRHAMERQERLNALAGIESEAERVKRLRDSENQGSL